MTAVAPTWKAAHALLGIVFLAGGVTAFGWPAATFVVLALGEPAGAVVAAVARRGSRRSQLPLGRAVAHSVCGAARALGRDRRP